MKLKKHVFFVLIALIALFAGNTVPAAAASQPFDTVLVLDVSGSMASSMDDMKSSAIRFCEQILENNAKNRIAVVAFAEGAGLCSEMTSDFAQLKSSIEVLSSDGGTNMYAGVALAFEQLSASSSARKNVIIMADGYPCAGEYNAQGKYSLEYQGEYYFDLIGYCNPVYDYVSKNIHPIANVYTVGYFDFDTENIPDTDLEARLIVEFMNDLANQKTYFPTEADVMFQDVAGDVIHGTGLSTGAIAAIIVIGVVGMGGLIGLVIGLCSRKTNPPPPSPMPPLVVPPVVLPMDDDEPSQGGQPYVSPAGIQHFAQSSGAAASSSPAASAVRIRSAERTAPIYGLSGTYRDAILYVSNGEVISIGREPSTNNLVITSDYTKISRVHCTVCYDAASDSFTVKDLSKNGIYTKHEKLPHGVSVTVPAGTDIKLADSVNIFRLG